MADSIKKTTVRIADDLAREAGHADAQEFITSTSARMRSGTPVDRESAGRAAGDFTSKLTLLTLYQTLQQEYNLGAYDWINKFETTKIEAGNSHLFVRDILTGVENYSETAFTPATVTLPQVDSHTISLYKTNTTSGADAVLWDWAKKIKKPLTILRDKWVPWFMSGKLQQFIEGISNNIRKTIHLTKLQIFQDLITKLKTGTSTAGNNQGMWNIINNPTGVNNILDVFTKVVFPNIQEMQFMDTKYNIGLVQPSGNSTANRTLNDSKPEDILLFVNVKTYTKLTTGVLSQVFNNKLLEIAHWIPKENIIPVSKKINVGNSTTAITTATEDLIGENEIVVLNKNALKTLLFVDTTESQSWAENMSIQLVAHLWLSCGIIPWGQGFVVRTNALTVMPSNPQGN